jgi:hypothetical protein
MLLELLSVSKISRNSCQKNRHDNNDNIIRLYKKNPPISGKRLLKTRIEEEDNNNIYYRTTGEKTCGFERRSRGAAGHDVM